jgi:hypothetical protein
MKMVQRVRQLHDDLQALMTESAAVAEAKQARFPHALLKTIACTDCF